MLDILAITGPIYLCIALGWLATRAGLFARADMRVLGRFVLYIALPALLFDAVGKRLCVGEASMRSDGEEELVAHATATYSVPPDRGGAADRRRSRAGRGRAAGRRCCRGPRPRPGRCAPATGRSRRTAG